jgi:hypothetical protein
VTGSHRILARGAIASVVLLLLVSVAGAGENRAWMVDLRLSGPLEMVSFDCGEEGGCDLVVSLREGEEIALSLPLPLRSPLGSDGLRNIPIPEARIRGAGRVEILGWSEAQPSDRIERLPPGLIARLHPAVPGPVRHASGAGLALLAAAFVLGLAWRRTRWRGPAVGVLVAGAVLWLTVTQHFAPVTVRVLEGDLATGAWLEARSARESLGEIGDRLEVVPEGRSVVFDLHLPPGAAGRSLRVVARSAGAELHSRRAVAHFDGLEASPGGAGPLEISWIRDSAGSWRGRGGWRWGEPAPGDRGPFPGDPPGWLEAGLPVGTGVLIGRFAGEETPGWLRVTGLLPETFFQAAERD